MEKMLVVCPGCGHEVITDFRNAGKKATCKKCGKKFTLRPQKRIPSAEAGVLEGVPVDGLGPEGPLTAAPPIEGQPIEGEPIEGEPIEGEPIEGEPVEAAPIEGIPVDEPPLEGVPIEGVPVEEPPLEAEVIRGIGVPVVPAAGFAGAGAGYPGPAGGQVGPGGAAPSAAQEALEQLAQGRSAPQAASAAMQLWLARYPLLTEQSLRKCIGEALGLSIQKGDDANFVVGKEMAADRLGLFIVKIGGQIYMLNAVNEPAVENPREAARDCTVPRLRHAILKHRAHIHMSLAAGTDERQGWQVIGRVLAALAAQVGADALALSVENAGAVAYDESLQPVLCGPEPLQVFATSPHVMAKVALLLSQPAEVDFDVLVRSGRRALGLPLDRQDGMVRCKPAGSEVLLLVGDCTLVVGEGDQPFFADRDAVAAQYPRAELAAAIRRHGGYLVLTMLDPPTPAHEDPAWRLLGRLILALAGPDCLVVHDLLREGMSLCDAAFQSRLAGSEAAAALAGGDRPPLAQADNNDPGFQAAVAEARRRWPEFVRAFAQLAGTHVFIVKAPFQEGEHREFMWVQVTDLQGDAIHGVLTNEPYHLRKYHQGDAVQLASGDVNDWAYGQNGPDVGNFTEKYLKKA